MSKKRKRNKKIGLIEHERALKKRKVVKLLKRSREVFMKEINVTYTSRNFKKRKYDSIILLNDFKIQLNEYKRKQKYERRKSLILHPIDYSTINKVLKDCNEGRETRKFENANFLIFYSDEFYL
jgi:hypothetical protein